MNIKPIYCVGKAGAQILVTYHTVFNRPIFYADGKFFTCQFAGIDGAFLRHADLRHIISAVRLTHHIKTGRV